MDLRTLAIGFLTVTAGCGGTQTIDVAAHPKLQPHDMVEFEYRNAKIQLDSVQFTHDSISGIPWHEPSLCCKRQVYAVADISTPKIRSFPALGTVFAGVLAVVLFLWIELAMHPPGGPSMASWSRWSASARWSSSTT